MCNCKQKSLIQVASSAQQAITLTADNPTAVLTLGTTAHQKGNDIRLEGNGIRIKSDNCCQDYFLVDANVTLTPAAAGNFRVTALQDNVALPGANKNITAVANGSIEFDISTTALLSGSCATGTITLVLSTTATLPATVTVNTTSMRVVEVD